MPGDLSSRLHPPKHAITSSVCQRWKYSWTTDELDLPHRECDCIFPSLTQVRRYILDHYVDIDDDGGDTGYRNLKNRSLVCLSWAKLYRSQLFARGVYLRSDEDLDTFLQYSRSVTRLPPLGSVKVTRKFIVDDASSRSWIDRLAGRIFEASWHWLPDTQAEKYAYAKQTGTLGYYYLTENRLASSQSIWGWLQIVPLSPPLAPNDAAQQPLPVAVPTTAASIPPELFPLILDYVNTDKEGRRDVSPSHRDLANCSLVCIHWAHCCRKQLENITLRSKEAAEELVRLTNSRTRLPRVIDFVNIVYIVHSSSSPSWIHLLSQIRWDPPEHRSIDQEPRKIYLYIRGGPLHYSIVNSLPWSLLESPCTGLFISDCTSRSLADLTKLASGARKVDWIKFDGVTWNVNQSSNRRLPFRMFALCTTPGGGADKWPDIEAHDCTNNALISLLTYFSLVASKSLHDVPARACVPLEYYDQSVVYQMTTELTRKENTCHIKHHGYNNSDFCSLVTFAINQPAWQLPSSSIEVLVPHPEPGQRRVQVTAIFIDYTPSTREEVRTEMISRWEAAISTARLLPALRTVIFYTQRVVHLRALFDDMVDRIGPLALPETVTLRYVHGRQDNNRWFEVARVKGGVAVVQDWTSKEDMIKGMLKS